MGIKLKPLEEQVLVITGASSGIGLATAREAARRGARVVLAARDEAALRRIADEICGAGGDAVYVVCDVADPEQVWELARTAEAEFGGFDTWVNNAGVSIFGEMENVPIEDARRLFDVNYWGVVHGSLAALPHLRQNGGALINMGSTTSDRAVPLQGHYSASKAAIKAFTDALRMELEHEGAPVSVTLVKPASIDTPYPEHARNLMEVEPKSAPPVYAPDLVADAVLHCAEHPRRSVTVGGGAAVNQVVGAVAPRLADRVMEKALFTAQRRDEPTPRRRRDTLFQPPRHNGRERGDAPDRVRETSVFTAGSLHRGRTALALAAVGAGLALAAGTNLFRGRNGETTVREPEPEAFRA